MATLQVLQGNLNHARQAQDLFLQGLAERGCCLGIVAEPYKLPPNSDCWAGDDGGSVAITWRKATNFPPCGLRSRGKGFVAVDWGPVSVVGVYIPPGTTRSALKGILNDIGGVLRQCRPRPIIVAGDFNAHHGHWGCKNPRQLDARGRALREWAAEQDLEIINSGSVSTCVRPLGESIVDLTWASPSVAGRIVDWAVDTESETLSDHRYIGWGLAPTAQQVLARRLGGRSPRDRRWALNKFDADKFKEAILAATWQDHLPGPRDQCLDNEADRLVGIVVSACDAAMPRSRPRPRRAVYWWCQAIADLRLACVQARRQCTAPPPQGDGDAARAREGYREARRALRASIVEAKVAAAKELAASLESDPWGRPYNSVMTKLRPWAPPTTEALDPQVLEGVVGSLFPTGRGSAPPEVDIIDGNVDWHEDLEVSAPEMRRAGRRLGTKRKAPGPDGIPGPCWAAALANEDLSASLRHLFSRCLRDGRFPRAWKRAKLVLIPKGAKAPGAPSAYRPICLLDEAGKMLERIIADRLVQHLEREGPDLHSQQFGFRRGRSTTDAVLCVRALARRAVEDQGGVALAVSLDIVNAFNTLPWTRVGGALDHHGVPLYLQRVIRDYFRSRDITYKQQGGVPRRRGIWCGVPQGSVLGPLLWDLVFDRVLRTVLPPGCSAVCYADDTLVIAGGDSWDEARALADIAVGHIVGSIKDLGLKVAPHKTEAIFFHDGSRGAPPPARVLVDGANVPVGTQITYLGLRLDGKWRFNPHFECVATRVARVGGALASLMRNTGGPSWRVRRLYLSVVASVALYAAPVWAAELEASRRGKALLSQAFRPALLGAARCYRSVSYEAAAVLAGFPPLELLATQYARVYKRVRELQGQGVVVTARAKLGLSLQAKARVMTRWAERISAPGLPGQRVLRAVQPCLQDWADRRGRGLTFRAAQVLSGHGSFGKFLCRIAREPTPKCHHCVSDQDTAQHTLEDCPAWADQRRVLVNRLGGADLSLPSIILRMLGSEECWAAMASFCEEVMAAKEEAEWARRPIHGRTGRLGRPGRGRAPRDAGPQAGARPRDGTVPLPRGRGGGGRAGVPRGAPPRRRPPGHTLPPVPTIPPDHPGDNSGPGPGDAGPRNRGRPRPARARIRRGEGGGSPVGGTNLSPHLSGDSAP